MRLFSIAAVCLVLVTFPLVVLSQDYVVVTVDNANIRTEPDGTVITQAQSGDVFELRGRNGDWLSILMFSGEYRAMAATLASRIELAPMQADEAARRRAFHAFVQAEDRATAEADRQIPISSPGTIKRNIDLQRVLDDRYKLAVCHQFNGLQPADYKAIVIEGLQKGWLR